jgi:hypothetical protein
LNKLEILINQLEAKIPLYRQVMPEVSQGSVGWHVEHCLLTVNGILAALAKSNPADYKWTFNFTRLLVFTMGKIPRGRAKSPKVVQPKENILENDLRIHLSETKVKIKDLDAISDDAFFNHPYFGNLKRKQAMRFLEIHTNHHLEIINDIVK